MFEKSRFTLRMRADDSLFRSLEFWTLTLAPAVLGASIIGIIAYKSNLAPQWDIEGLKNFYDFFKLPLAISSLSIPTGALSAAHHRSLQTAKQIKQQNDQNKFSNRISHKESFTKFFHEVKPFGSTQTKNSWELYESIFPIESIDDLSATHVAETIIIEIIDLQNVIIASLSESLKIRESVALDSVQAYLKFKNVRKKTDYLLGASLPYPTENIKNPPVTNFISSVVKVALGLKDCANFQRPSITSSLSQKLTNNLNIIDKLEIEYNEKSEVADLMRIYLNSESDPSISEIDKVRAKYLAKLMVKNHRVEELIDLKTELFDIKEYFLSITEASQLSDLEPIIINEFNLLLGKEA